MSVYNQIGDRTANQPRRQGEDNREDNREDVRVELPPRAKREDVGRSAKRPSLRQAKQEVKPPVEDHEFATFEVDKDGDPQVKKGE